MSPWKAIFIVTFAAICLALALAAIVVPMAVEERGWLWFVGLLFATLVMGTLLVLFLQRADRTFK